VWRFRLPGGPRTSRGPCRSIQRGAAVWPHSLNDLPCHSAFKIACRISRHHLVFPKLPVPTEPLPYGS
jgi:hypothetical protein